MVTLRTAARGGELSMGTAGARQRAGAGHSMPPQPREPTGGLRGTSFVPRHVSWASLPPWAQAALREERGGGVRARVTPGDWCCPEPG